MHITWWIQSVLLHQSWQDSCFRSFVSFWLLKAVNVVFSAVSDHFLSSEAPSLFLWQTKGSFYWTEMILSCPEIQTQTWTQTKKMKWWWRGPNRPGPRTEVPELRCQVYFSSGTRAVWTSSPSVQVGVCQDHRPATGTSPASTIPGRCLHQLVSMETCMF